MKYAVEMASGGMICLYAKFHEDRYRRSGIHLQTPTYRPTHTHQHTHTHTHTAI
jgi:hypothetical protein